jgi:hypothetical protein
MIAIAFVFPIVPVTAGSGIIKASVSRIRSALSTGAIEFVIVTSSMPCIPLSVITIAPAMFVTIIVFGVGDCR